MPDDITAAARQVADSLRKPNTFCDVDDLRTLLPVLDAVAAGRGDGGRVERWARAMCRAAGNREMAWEAYTHDARAAIALADAEGAAETAKAPRR